ncbi:predicted protein [Verticillium alfalfae VaMs.102]|uniref:Predicted protein n=1 Tax=Verticillium alfalfae (strain VaMs.102 / ATCC MYA-4576 / FGSC 10136) TaxID=526221 RepID=C9SJA0_VERA1|nr:predicted protein [Verticillium alfalfae VaMs.102]EEY18262.1 predicted protein [Verticillium alfalfae VaMs.102]
MATTALSGVAFGAGLAAAGVYHPAVITSQLKFENWHMIQAFLAAAASSGIAVLLLDRLGYYHSKPRSASRLGLFGPYDGNILGGALQGLGMALAGACPGTVIPQAAVGVPLRPLRPLRHPHRWHRLVRLHLLPRRPRRVSRPR